MGINFNRFIPIHWTTNKKDKVMFYSFMSGLDIGFSYLIIGLVIGGLIGFCFSHRRQ